jgi:hypothetical protein
MRLTPAQIATIKSTAQAVLGGDAQVWLYGSRLDDQRKGVNTLIKENRDQVVMVRHPGLRSGIHASRGDGPRIRCGVTDKGHGPRIQCGVT